MIRNVPYGPYQRPTKCHRSNSKKEGIGWILHFKGKKYEFYEYPIRGTGRILKSEINQFQGNLPFKIKWTEIQATIDSSW